MKMEKYETIKIEVDKVREIYIMLRNEDNRPFAEIYTAYKGFGVMEHEFGVFCDIGGTQDPEKYAINLAIQNYESDNLMWPEISEEDMDLVEILSKK